MVSANFQDRKSFLIFLIGIIVTGCLIVLFSGSAYVLGLIGILWGVFGFLRLIYLTSLDYEDRPKILNLPAQILFGLAQQQKQEIAETLTNMGRYDIIFWMCGSLIFIAFAILSSFFPSELSIIKTLNLKQEVLVDFPLQNHMDPYALMKGLSFYGVIGIIIFCAFTFSGSRTHLRWAAYSILPVFLSACLFTLFFSPIAQPFLWPDLAMLKGGGLGQANILDIVAPNMMSDSGTGLIRRFTEMGAIGAYGTYILYIPALFVLIKALFEKNTSFFYVLICLCCLGFLFILDLFWVSTPIIHGLMVLGLSLSALCWGAAPPRQ